MLPGHVRRRNPMKYVHPLAFLLLLALAGCAHHSVSIQSSGQPSRIARTGDESLLPPDLVQLFQLEAGDQLHLTFVFGRGEYHILPGDIIKVSFGATSVADVNQTVRPDGKITLPDTGEVTAGGLSPNQLAASIRSIYLPKMIDPKVTVTVVKSNVLLIDGLSGDYYITPEGTLSVPYLGEIPVAGLGQREVSEKLAAAARARFQSNIEAYISMKEGTLSIYVGGEVTKPAAYPFEGGMTVLKAVTAAGGFTPDANTKEVVLIHYQGEQKVTVYKTSVRAVVADASGFNDLRLSPHDVVFVPKTGIAQADLFVDQYINKLVPRAFNVSYILQGTYVPGL
jgi:protein involved in polysaccharide export with SLBB domain